MRNFKKTLRAVLWFLAAFAVLTAAVVTPYYAGTTYYFQDAGVRRDLAGSFNVLISSASQGLRAIDPRALNDALGCRSYNLGAPLQTMYGRYLTFKTELERNPVELVIIDVAYDSLTRDYENGGVEGGIYQLGRSDSLGQWLDYFFHEIRPADWSRVYYDTLLRGVHCWKSLLKNGIQPPHQYETFGFQTGLQCTPMPDASTYARDYRTETICTEIQPESREYMEKCVALCHQMGVEVVLIATPLSEHMLWSTVGLEEISRQYRQLADYWGEPFYDFNLKKDKLERYPEDTAYCDEHHLCEAAAQVFPYDLAEVLHLAEAGGDVEALFYDTYEEAIRGRAGT